MNNEVLLTQGKWLPAMLMALTIAGCSSIPTQTSAPTKSSGATPVLPAANSGRGGYYKDDGPGDQTPAGLEKTPDAEPRVEAPLPRANRPYVVFGNAYTPIAGNRPFKQRGIGSWYGKKFHGQKTSSGEVYDMYKMTAAHPTLPLPSYARVTNQVNGRQIIVRVNDRGPFHADRIIDLSYTAALKLGYLGKGSGMLEVELLLPEEIARITQARQAAGSRAVALGSAQPADSTQAVGSSQPRAASHASEAYPPLPASVLTASAVTPPPTPQSAVESSGYFLQFGAFTQAQNAQALRAQYSPEWKDKLPPFEVVRGGLHYRVFSGPFASRDKAMQAAQQLREASALRPVVVQR